MKYLLSDTFVSKFRKIPTWVWYIFSAVSFVFADAYAVILTGENSIFAITPTLQEMYGNTIQLNNNVFLILYCIFESFLYEILFEVIGNIASGICIARFNARTNRSDFRFRLRLCAIYANILVGLIGISYFFTQHIDGNYTGTFALYGAQSNAEMYSNDVYSILSSIVPYAVFTFFMWFFYVDFKTNYLSGERIPRSFSYIASRYCGISTAVSLAISLYNTVLFNTELDIISIIAYWLSVAINIIGCVLAYVYYKKLKKDSDKHSDDNPTIVFTIKEEPEKHNIYDDLGF